MRVRGVTRDTGRERGRSRREKLGKKGGTLWKQIEKYMYMFVPVLMSLLVG